MKQQKYYVVWKGRVPGVYDNWEECSAQTNGFVGAVFKSFINHEAAKLAFERPAPQWREDVKTVPVSTKTVVAEPCPNSISVDGAANDKGIFEYRGVHNKTNKIIFSFGPMQGGTNNIAEFLALVHALAYCKQNNLAIPIYSDSQTALAWLRKKSANTSADLENNLKLKKILARAEEFLKANTWKNKVLKWHTKHWGEISADYGRKK